MGYLLEVKKKDSYATRIRRNIWNNILITSLIVAIIAAARGYMIMLPVGLFLFVVQYFKSAYQDKYFITRLEIDTQVISVSYDEKGEAKTITGDISKFSIRKKVFPLNKSRTVFLAIYYENSLKVRQFEIDPWTEKVFDKITDAFCFNSPQNEKN